MTGTGRHIGDPATTRCGMGKLITEVRIEAEKPQENRLIHWESCFFFSGAGDKSHESVFGHEVELKNFIL